MAYCVVNGVRYEAIANQQVGIKSAEQLLKDIAQNIQLSAMPETDFETIVSDLVWEKREFKTWAALAKEIELRRVGYAVESTLRSMYESNRAKDEKFQAAQVSLAKQRQQLFEAQENPETKLKDIDYRAAQKAIDDDAVINEASDQNILRWNPTTFPTYSYRDNQVMEWWLGLRNDEPKRANCWECALLALLNTRSLNPPKGYMVWCVDQIDTKICFDFDPNDIRTKKVSRLYSCAIKTMDYYFPHHGAPVLDANKEIARPSKNTTDCFDLPMDIVIPRGRLLIFDYLAHVGISTGEMRPITTEEGRDAWGRTMGHGILDLNAVGQTIRERTIEDFARAGNCNNQLIVAPFPICNETGSIAIKGQAPPLAADIEAHRRKLNEVATDEYDARVKHLEDVRTKAKERGKQTVQQIDKKYAQDLSAAKALFEKAVVLAAQNINEKVKFLRDVLPEPRQENFTLEYGPFDPYNGKVTF